MKPGPPAGGSSQLPTFNGTPQHIPHAASDQRLAPRITGLDDRLTGVTLRWTDPTNGQATFLIIRRSGDITDIITPDPGTTQIHIESLDPAVPKYCFMIVAIFDAERRAASAEHCTPARH